MLWVIFIFYLVIIFVEEKKLFLKKKFINFFALSKNWKKQNTDHSYNIANYLRHIWFPSNYVWSYYYYYYYYQMSLKRPDVWSLNLHSEWQKISRYFGPQLAGANWPPLYSWVLLKKPFSMRSATICRFCPPSLRISFILGPRPIIILFHGCMKLLY